MVPQSRALPVLLTRPAAQSVRFAAAVQARFPGTTVLQSPLMAPAFLTPDIPSRDWAAFIFTSETAVLSARRIAADGASLPRLAFCVGDQTAKVARAQGFDAVSAQGDGAALVALITAQAVKGPLLHLHGVEVRVDVGQGLILAGIETVSAVSYAQMPQPLTPQVAQVLRGAAPVIAPIFSPRTAQLLMQDYARVGAVAPMYVVAISAAAAEGVTAAQVIVATRPDATAILDAMAVWLA